MRLVLLRCNAATFQNINGFQSASILTTPLLLDITFSSPLPWIQRAKIGIFVQFTGIALNYSSLALTAVSLTEISHISIHSTQIYSQVCDPRPFAHYLGVIHSQQMEIVAELRTNGIFARYINMAHHQFSQNFDTENSIPDYVGRLCSNN